MVDCVTFCFGCSGGSRDGAYLYVIDKQGGQFNLDIDYPYTATDGKCMFIKEKAVGGISDYTQSKKEDEDDLLAFVAQYGPTSVGIDASGSRFALYSSGIYDDTLLAAHYSKKADDLGNYKAMGQYGYCLENGLGVKVNKKEAERYYQMSVDGGYKGWEPSLQRLRAKSQCCNIF